MKLNEPNVLKVRLHHISLDRAAPHLKVMMTGDWHISPIVSEQQLEYLKTAIVEADPDLIILQGDIVDSPIELKRETSLNKLLTELKICAMSAPTVMVLGSHDYITPTVPAKNMGKFAIPFWKKVCKKCGVKLLLDEWADFPGIKIFGAFQDERCLMSYSKEGLMRYKDNPEGFLKCLEKSKPIMKEGLKKKANKIIWFASHAPLLNAEVVKMLEPFDVASFGHTHGGIVPLGLDEVFEKCGWHFGLISPNHTPFPKRVRGVTPISDSTMLAVNPGMIATHFCVSKALQNMNFIKAAEVSVIEIDGKKAPVKT